MSLAKLAVVASVAAVGLSACGTAVHSTAAPGVSRGRVDDPRTAKSDRVQCMRAKRLPVQEVGATSMQIGAPPDGARVVFEPTPGAAQGVQIQGEAQGAEVIGSALLYPNQAPADQLGSIEACLAQGVSG